MSKARYAFELGRPSDEGKAMLCPRKRLGRCHRCSEDGEPAGSQGTPKQASRRTGPRRARAAVERGRGMLSTGTGKDGCSKQTATVVESCGGGLSYMVRRPEAPPGLSTEPRCGLATSGFSPHIMWGTRRCGGGFGGLILHGVVGLQKTAGGQRLSGKWTKGLAGTGRGRCIGRRCHRMKSRRLGSVGRWTERDRAPRVWASKPGRPDASRRRRGVGGGASPVGCDGDFAVSAVSAGGCVSAAVSR